VSNKRPHCFGGNRKRFRAVSEKNSVVVVQTALANAGKFVPEVVVSGDGGGLEGFAAVLGHLLKKPEAVKTK
jgi:hypothetical protein